MTIAYITHPTCSLHDMGEGHPESPARLAVIEDQLLATGLHFAIRRYDAPAVTREQLQRVHDPRFVDRIFALAPSTGLCWLDRDTAMSPHTLEAALHAAGAVVYAVDLVVGGQETSAVAAYSTISPWELRMPCRSTVCSASPSSISTSIMATAPRTSFGTSHG
jgi:acetoin utilization deacetylase AcuC-like enzyme